MVDTEHILIILFVTKDGQVMYIYSAKKKKKRLETGCGSGHELHIAKLRVEESRENYLAIQILSKSNPLRLYSGGDE